MKNTSEGHKLVAILENPNYIINIGTVVRIINALGVDELLVVDGQKRLEDNLEKIRQRKSILKHSNGAIKYTEVKVFETSENCFKYLNENGFTSIGTSPHPICKKQISLTESDLTIPKLAIWFGEEANGLSEYSISNCDYCLNIPMRGKVESLNLSSSLSIVMYEALRQRDKPTS